MRVLQLHTQIAEAQYAPADDYPCVGILSAPTLSWGANISGPRPAGDDGLKEP